MHVSAQQITIILNEQQAEIILPLHAPHGTKSFFLFDAFVIWYFKEGSIMRMHA